MQIGIFLYFSMYLSDQLLSSVLVFSPNLFLEGQMVFITENFDACLSKVVFYIGPNFLVQYKFGNHLWVWVECSICRNFHWLCRFIIETVYCQMQLFHYIPETVNIYFWLEIFLKACANNNMKYGTWAAE